MKRCRRYVDPLDHNCRLKLISANSPPQLMREIESQAMVAQQQINIVKAQVAAKQRDVRLLQLTSSEVSDLPKDTNVYEGVGKM